jgi:hypothetical protein
MDNLPTDPPVIVIGPAGDPPYRRVEIRHQPVGKAYRVDDVVEFARRAGLDHLDLEADGSVQWIGGGSHQWEE